MTPPLYRAGYRTGQYDFEAGRPLRVFRSDNDVHRNWIAGYRDGYADGCRGRADVNPELLARRIRSGPVQRLTAASIATSIFAP